MWQRQEKWTIRNKLLDYQRQVTTTRSRLQKAPISFDIPLDILLVLVGNQDSIQLTTAWNLQGSFKLKKKGGGGIQPTKSQTQAKHQQNLDLFWKN